MRPLNFALVGAIGRYKPGSWHRYEEQGSLRTGLLAVRTERERTLTCSAHRLHRGWTVRTQLGHAFRRERAQRARRVGSLGGGLVSGLKW